MNHSGMDMDHGAGTSCKISMLWNWHTIDACFLSSSWHVTTKGTFALSCIGVMLLVVCLEALRRAGIEFEKALSRQLTQRQQSYINLTRSSHSNLADTLENHTPQTVVIRITPLQQLARAVLHAVTLGLAYIVMLLAMYFNGYIIISIILGAGIGKFFCDWKSSTFTVLFSLPADERPAQHDSGYAVAKVDSLQSSEQVCAQERSHTLCCE